MAFIKGFYITNTILRKIRSNKKLIGDVDDDDEGNDEDDVDVDNHDVYYEECETDVCDFDSNVVVDVDDAVDDSECWW